MRTRVWFGMLETWVLQWGYLAVGVGTMLEGETVLLAAGAMAHRGLLGLPGVMIAAFLGGVFNDVMWFLIGRRAGRAFLVARPRLAKHAAVVDRWIARSGTLFVLGFRFLPGVRTVGPLLLGAGAFPVPRFLLLNALAAAAWVGLVTSIGYGLGAWLSKLFGRATRLEEVALVAVVLALAVFIVVRRREKADPADGTPLPLEPPSKSTTASPRA
ncbi:MAG: DedA family protein [Polyangiales bacterium]